MTKRRHKLLVALVAAGVLAAFAGLWRASRAPGVSYATFDRIQVGMSKSEVEAVLGNRNRPEEDYVPEPAYTAGYRRYRWQAGDLTIAVDFNPDGTVKGKNLDDMGMSSLTFLQRVRLWLGR